MVGLQTPPLSPSELLVALHTVESKSDVKAIMKGNYIQIFFSLRCFFCKWWDLNHRY